MFAARAMPRIYIPISECVNRSCRRIGDRCHSAGANAVSTDTSRLKLDCVRARRYAWRPPSGPRRARTAVAVQLLPSVDWLRLYPRSWFRPDLTAGLTTAAVVVPKAMAFATIAAATAAHRPLHRHRADGRLCLARNVASAQRQHDDHHRHPDGRRNSRRSAPGGDAAAPHRRRGHAVGAGRRPPRARLVAPPGIHRQLHLRSGAHRLQVGHRAGDRRRPAPEAAGRPLSRRPASSAT